MDLDELLQDMQLQVLVIEAQLRAESRNPRSELFGVRQDADGRWWFPAMTIPVSDDAGDDPC